MKNVIIYLVILALLYSLLYQCNTIIDNNKIADANIDVLTDSVKYYQNSLRSQTASIKTLQLSEHQMKKLVIEKDRELKSLAKEFASVRSFTKVKSKLAIDTIAVKFEVPIPVCDSANFRRIGKISSEWYTVNYKVSPDSLTLSDFNALTETFVITGTKRNWFLGKQIVTTEVTNSNPYITLTGIKAAEVTVPEPWYKKWYLWFAAGIAAGFFIN